MIKDFYKKYSTLVYAILGFFIICGGYWFLFEHSGPSMSPPSFKHWFGTGLTGNDIFVDTMSALGLEILTLLVVIPVIYFLGLLLGTLLSYFSTERMREFLLNLIHYWVTLPILLIALFLLILLGAGQKNAVFVIVFVFVPTQALYVYNRLESVKKSDFVVAKKSFGFSKLDIYKNQLFPNIQKDFTSYTLARMPEIIMMNLALNFFGHGSAAAD